MKSRPFSEDKGRAQPQKFQNLDSEIARLALSMPVTRKFNRELRVIQSTIVLHRRGSSCIKFDQSMSRGASFRAVGQETENL